MLIGQVRRMAPDRFIHLACKVRRLSCERWLPFSRMQAVIDAHGIRGSSAHPPSPPHMQSVILAHARTHLSARRSVW